MFCLSFSVVGRNEKFGLTDASAIELGFAMSGCYDDAVLLVYSPESWCDGEVTDVLLHGHLLVRSVFRVDDELETVDDELDETPSDTLSLE